MGVCDRPAPGSLEQLIDCSGGEEINEETGYARKAVALLVVLKDQAAARTIVFCNKINTCRMVRPPRCGCAICRDGRGVNLCSMVDKDSKSKL